MSFSPLPKYDNRSQPVPLYKLITLPQMLSQPSFIHSPNKYLLSATHTLPANSNSLFMTSSVRRDSCLPQDKRASLGHGTSNLPL